SHIRDVLVLNVFKGDWFSVLKHCHVTQKIEIWVTKNKVNVENGDGLIPYFMQPSSFIDNNERLVICSCDKTGKPWIYVMGDNKLISKVQLDSVDPWPLHCTYLPSLVPVPRGQRDEEESQV
ncbi:unnamed protein product, partial [Eruca vesicaria subsp. sativa]|nr:unnamed protein product [Eruca vesicaria subsp. sativa]